MAVRASRSISAFALWGLAFGVMAAARTASAQDEASAAPVPLVPPAPSPAEPPRDRAWYDVLELGAFVDAYASVNYRFPKPEAATNRYRPYDANNGFNLAWVGLDASLAPDPVGATLQLRFGPSVPNLALGDFALPGGIGFVQNGYVSWKPRGKDDKLTLILGKFDTIYGAEVAQSQLNVNYTRGALYNLAQPFFHTGFRADYQASDLVGLRVLAVNGWNNTLDNNTGKSFGGQVTLTPSEVVGISVGYLGGPEQPDTTVVACAADTAFDLPTGACAASPGAGASSTAQRVVGANSRWRHLADLVVDLHPSKASRVVLNGTFGTESISGGASQAWYGASLIGRYAFTDVYAAGVRGEYIVDKSGFLTGFIDGHLATATLTLEAAPMKYLLLRLDSRVDAMNKDAFQEGYDQLTKTQITSTLGVVARTK